MNKLPSLVRSYEDVLAAVTKQIERDPGTFARRWLAEARQLFSTNMEAIKELQVEMFGYQTLVAQLRQAQTILFSTEQVEVFRDLPPAYADTLDYRLPFPFLFIQLSTPLVVDVPMDGHLERSSILYFVLVQAELTEETLAEYKRLYADPMILTKPGEYLAAGILNNITVVYDDLRTTRFGWMAESQHEFLIDYADDVNAFKSLIKRLCIACVGYINCENVYLEKHDGATEVVNRKRAAKGKDRIEPYYVCRVRGVQSASHATGTGPKRSIRFDVRGHFRRLESGKTIWVRPHQRGLQNELYVPKVYEVEKGSKPAYGA